MKKLVFLLVLLFLGACQPAHIDPPVLPFSNADKRDAAARKYRDSVNGFYFIAADTHSMEPTIWGGDWLIEVRKPIEQVEIGEIITDRGDWQKPEAPPETHRVVLKDKDGLMVSGDNVNPVQADGVHSETQYRVREDNYIGTVLRIYRVTKVVP